LAAKSPQEAVEAFLTPFKAVVGCITDGGFVARISRPGGPYPATFQSGFAELARSGGRPPIQLKLTHTYVPRKEVWRIILDNHERQFWETRTWA